MYPATTSLVNVVPKLSSTGRDLLQVKDFHYGNNELMISCFSFIFLCLSFAESSEVQSSTANFSRGSPTAPLLCRFLPTLNARSPWPQLGTQMGQSYLVKTLQHLQRSVLFQISPAIAGQRDPETLLPLHVYDLIIMIWLWPWLSNAECGAVVLHKPCIQLESPKILVFY